MVVNESTIQELRKLGMSEYEARAYGGLLAEHPQTPYELARSTGIPSSKIYEVLSRLEATMTVQALRDQDRVRYMPQNPADFLARHQAALDQTLEHLSRELPRIGEDQTSPVWNIHRREDLLLQVRSMVDSCQQELLVSVWEEDLSDLEPWIRRAQTRNAKVALVIFGNQRPDWAPAWTHPIRDTLAKEDGGRTLVLCADRCQALSATFKEADRLEASWSRSGGFVRMAREYIRHDIYVARLVETLGPQMRQEFGPDFQGLRDIFTAHTGRKP